MIPAGIDPRDFPLAKPRARPWRWRLLCVGRLESQKGFDTAVRALVELPAEALLTIVGDGPRRDELARLATDTGVKKRVRFLRAERSEMRDHYSAADALLFTSTGPEAFGLVPLEAMACATPVVATGAGGSAEFLRHESNCLLVPPADPQALAAAIERLADDAALRQRLVEGGLRTAARLTVDRQAEALELQIRGAG